MITCYFMVELATEHARSTYIAWLSKLYRCFRSSWSRNIQIVAFDCNWSYHNRETRDLFLTDAGFALLVIHDVAGDQHICITFKADQRRFPLNSQRLFAEAWNRPMVASVNSRFFTGIRCTDRRLEQIIIVAAMCTFHTGCNWDKSELAFKRRMV
uniref:Transposase n=1 Tax=Ditylenchus dipsaci TaxID=166011 RepID=A0A915EJQ1_9BILA